jgi:hypothetical protein
MFTVRVCDVTQIPNTLENDITPRRGFGSARFEQQFAEGSGGGSLASKLVSWDVGLSGVQISFVDTAPSASDLQPQHHQHGDAVQTQAHGRSINVSTELICCTVHTIKISATTGHQVNKLDLSAAYVQVDNQLQSKHELLGGSGKYAVILSPTDKSVGGASRQLQVPNIQYCVYCTVRTVHLASRPRS